MRVAARRRGTSLLEVIVAVTIMFAAVVAISQLLDLSNIQANEINEQSLAVQRCQSKMAEVVSGSVPLEDGDGGFDEDAEQAVKWEWNVSAVPGDAANLYTVTVTVRRTGSSATPVKLTQIVLDPKARGSTQDVPETTTTDPAATTPGTGTTNMGQ